MTDISREDPIRIEELKEEKTKLFLSFLPLEMAQPDSNNGVAALGGCVLNIERNNQRKSILNTNQMKLEINQAERISRSTI